MYLQVKTEHSTVSFPSSPLQQHTQKINKQKRRSCHQLGKTNERFYYHLKNFTLTVRLPDSRLFLRRICMSYLYNTPLFSSMLTYFSPTHFPLRSGCQEKKKKKLSKFGDVFRRVHPFLQSLNQPSPKFDRPQKQGEIFVC